MVYFYLPPRTSAIIENLANNLKIEYVKHISNYIQKPLLRGLILKPMVYLGHLLAISAYFGIKHEKLVYRRLKAKKKKWYFYKNLLTYSTSIGIN
jgi:hypothetical protein